MQGNSYVTGDLGIGVEVPSEKLDVAGTPVPLPLGGKRRTLVLHAFLDKSVLEVFIDGGRECVTQVIYPGGDDLGVEVFAEGGTATVRSLDVWQLGSIWDRP